MNRFDTNEHMKTRIAWLYYVEGKTQDEIVTLTGISRSRVLRILAASRRDGTVQIRVTNTVSKCVELERALEERWRLNRAIVIPEPQDPSQTSAILGAELGAYLSQHLAGHITVGLGWGNTLSRALPSIVPRQAEGIRVLSLLGGLTRVSSVNPSEFAWRVADRLAAECHLMTAPVFAPDRSTQESLRNHPGIAEIYSRARMLDTAIVSVGALTANSLFYEYGLLTREEIASLEAAGAVGDVLCHFIDQDGQIIDHPVNERVVAVDPRGLRGARDLILVSGGWHKLKAISAAMRLLQPSVLILNEHVAERLALAEARG